MMEARQWAARIPAAADPEVFGASMNQLFYDIAADGGDPRYLHLQAHVLDHDDAIFPVLVVAMQL